MIEKSGAVTFCLEFFVAERREGLAGDYSGTQAIIRRVIKKGAKGANTLSGFVCAASCAFFDFCNRFDL